MIARIIKAEVCVICQSRRLRRITQTERHARLHDVTSVCKHPTDCRYDVTSACIKTIIIQHIDTLPKYGHKTLDARRST